MKTLIYGAGSLGSLYTHLLHKAGNDVTIFARNEHFNFLKKNGVVLHNELTQEKITEMVKVVNSLNEEDYYDLVIVLMRKNSIKNILPILSENKKVRNFLFLGNSTLGFDEYLKYLPKEKVLFGFPGGGGSRIDHIAHYIDSEKLNGKSFDVKEISSDDFSTTSMCTLSNFSISLMFEPPLPMIDAIFRPSTETRTLLSDKISTSALES